MKLKPPSARTFSNSGLSSEERPLGSRQKNGRARGAERLHWVDRNGAVTGEPVHRSLIEDMVHSVSIPLEVGGGIRDLQTIERYLAAGIRWAILGSIAFQNPRLIHEACLSFPDSILLAVDPKRGKVDIP